MDEVKTVTDPGAFVAILSGGPCDGQRVRADMLDPHRIGALHLQIPREGGDELTAAQVVTYWRRDGQDPGDLLTVWDWKS